MFDQAVPIVKALVGEKRANSLVDSLGPNEYLSVDASVKVRESILDEKGINQLEKQVEDDLQIAVDQALEAALPTPNTIENDRNR